ncbi:MAG TPA: asparaginase [Candidatus Ruania gallistercoris]|uniref:asparaginase n=1 Tax=Candidatus Ruania gallistercoris TaxID=2838746 RepID=A0A9D2J521_9MICO|nr:asparaginase [Candidatus Ruania gallistercoris]
MARVVVLATGGTIASAAAPGGGVVAQRSVSELIGSNGGGGIDVHGRDVVNQGSYLMRHRDIRTIAEAVAAEVGRADVDGVVVTHGTDTMEETGYLLDLLHGSPKPVVLTGAQRPADQPDTDGPRNLHDAIAVAAAPQARDRGVLLAFGGRIFATARTRKFYTVAPEPFVTIGGGPIGTVRGDEVVITADPVRPPTLAPLDERFDTTRVDVVVAYPDADAALAEAAVAAGARGVVLAALGSGNGNHALVDWVRRAVGEGVAVGLSTRVPEGPVVPIYSNGGAVDLLSAGAVNLRSLPLFHSRMLFAALLSSGTAVDEQTIAPYV